MGNVVFLEHVNTAVPDQQLATTFYVSGLGLTRDPYMMTGIENMWINVGGSQFHLPTAPAQVVRGRIGVVVPDLAALMRQLSSVKSKLASTMFHYVEGDGHVDVVSPWGNRYRCHAPRPAYGVARLALPYVAYDVPAGAAAGIAAFYREILDAPAQVVDGDDAPCAQVAVGDNQAFRFQETAAPLAGYDGHHVQVYVADFDAVYRRLESRGLVTEPMRAYQYRFDTIVDTDGATPLYQLEHEVRSTRHPLYRRPLVNRNAAQTNRHYVPGNDALEWQGMPR